MNLANWPRKLGVSGWLVGVGLLLAGAGQAAVIAQSTSEVKLTLTSMTGSLLYSAATPTIVTNESSSAGVATATNTPTFDPPTVVTPLVVGNTLSIVSTIQDAANGPGGQANSELTIKDGLFLFSGAGGAVLEFSYLFTGSLSTVEDVPADVSYAEAGFDIQVNNVSQQGTQFSVDNGGTLTQSEQGTFTITMYPYMGTTIDVYATALGNVKAYKPPVVPAPAAFWLLLPALAGFVWNQRCREGVAIRE